MRDARQNMTTHRWTIGLGFPLAPAGCDHCGWPTPKLSGCQPHDSPPQPPHGGGGGARSARQQAHWKVFNFSGAGLESGVASSQIGASGGGLLCTNLVVFAGGPAGRVWPAAEGAVWPAGRWRRDSGGGGFR